MKIKKIGKRILTILLIVCMMFSSAPSYAMEPEDKAEEGVQKRAKQGYEDNLIADFDFDDEASGLKGAGAKAFVNGTASYSASYDTEAGKAMNISPNNWLSVSKENGEPLLKGLEEVTVSFDCKPSLNGHKGWLFFAAPNTSTQIYQQEHYLGLLDDTEKIQFERYYNSGARPDNNISVSSSSNWKHIDLVLTLDTSILYVDGVKAGEHKSSYKVSDIFKDKGIIQIGKGNWENGEYYDGLVDNYQIYNIALPESELIDPVKVVEADQTSLSLEKTVYKDFELPAAGKNGSQITWSVVTGTDYIEIVDNRAILSRQDDTDQVVIIKAVLSMGSAKADKEFELTLPKESITDDEVIAEVEAMLDVPNADNIRGNVCLPTEMQIGTSNKEASIVWSSSHPEIVNPEKEGKKPAGVVDRPAEDTLVTLKGSITCGSGMKKTKTLQLNVKAAYSMPETTSYLFAFFSDNNQSKEQVFYAASEDGDNWMDLYADRPVLSVMNNTEYGGEMGVRDPYIIRAPEGDKFYMLATDACVGLNGFTTGYGQGSRYLVVWESYDLVNWSEPWRAEVAHERAGNTWAPEAFYNEETGEYLVFWSSIVHAAPYNDGQQRVWYSKTRDFRSFTEPRLFIERVTNGKARHVIDTNIVDGGDGHYYRMSTESGVLTMDRSDEYSLLGTWTELGSFRDLVGADVYGDSDVMEGPEFFKYNKDDAPEGKELWAMMADRYGGNRGYIPYKTTDIGDGNKWIKPGEDEFNYDTMLKRHGGILQITDEEYKNIMMAYGPSEISVKKAPDKKEYQLGDTVNLSGLVLDVSYQGGLEETISYNSNQKNKRQFTTDVSTLDKEGTQKITVTYGGASTSFDVTVSEYGPNGEKISDDPVLEYNFESDLGTKKMSDTGIGSSIVYNGNLFGNAEIVYDEERQSNVLLLDGSNESYGEIPSGFFDGRDRMTISMDVKSELSDGNFFTFTYGKNNSFYYILRIRGKEVRSAVTLNGWQYEADAVVPNTVANGEWQNVTIVIDKTVMKVYVDGVLAVTNGNTKVTTTDMGSDLHSYLGKSFYGDDRYFKGSFDNIQVYNKALSDEAIAENVLDRVNLMRSATIGSIPEDPSECRGTDYHTAISTKLNRGKKEITSYIRKHADITSVPVTLNILSDQVAIDVEGQEGYVNGDALDLSGDRKVTLTWMGKTEEWTIKSPQIANNPVLPGHYADPDIDYFDGKYWIYPTTDGYPGWDGSAFHAFSSTDLVNWEDEGIIVDLAADKSYMNEKGVEVATVDWARGSAWAPSIEKKNGKYYFYFCGDNGNAKAIGVAVADHPAGPYTAKSTPLLTIEETRAAGIQMGQVIDPSIYTEGEVSYMLFGNGNTAIVELNDDMMSWKAGTLKNIAGLKDFRESVIVNKTKDGTYHFTWSCDDTGSPNYHVKYGTSKSLYGPVDYKYILLQKDEAGDMLGTAHHSILEKDGRYYIAYHRFYTPLGVYTDGFGNHRETCIDEVFMGSDGLMQPLIPTMEGVTAPEYATVTYTAGTGGKIIGSTVQTLAVGNKSEEVEAAALAGYEFIQWSDGNKSAKRSDVVTENAFYQAEFARIKEADPVKEVEDLIDAVASAKSESELLQLTYRARAAYDKLNQTQKAEVSNYKKLTDAEGEIASNKEVQEVEKLIDAIGMVEYTSHSKSKIDYARNAYNKLPQAERAKVTNYSKLIAAETAYQMKKKEAEQKPSEEKPSDELLVSGRVYQAGNYKYKVTNIKKGTVSVVGVIKKSLKSISVKDTVKIKGQTLKVTDIGKSAFKNCRSAQSVKIGKNVKTIGENAFYGCKKIKKVNITSTVLTKIRKKAFYNCKKLVKLDIKSKKLKAVEKQAFKGIGSKAKIKVPKEKLTKYRRIMKNKGQKSTVKIIK